MTHPGEGELQAFIDGEIAADERARVATHLEECADCRAALQELRAAGSLFSAAVRRADAAGGVATDLTAARLAVLQRAGSARTGRPALRLLPQQGTRAAAVRRAFLRAAVLVLLVAGAAAAAVPGWPVRRFLVGLWHETTRLFGAHPAAPPPPAPARVVAAPAPALPSGVSVLPEDGQVRIVVRDAARGLRVHVRVLETDRASVEADGPAASAHFRTAPGRIEVSGGGAGDLRIGLPRSAQHASVQVAGKLVFSRDAGRTRHFAPVDTSGGDAVFLTHP